jgi:hypothetical protein
MATEHDKSIEEALAREDLMALASIASAEELQRLKAAEELIEKRYVRKTRGSRIGTASAALVGYVALAGFFANAYQNWSNKTQQTEQARLDNARWEKEFKRAQDADKYRAFFETSALATDIANPDKRLVGYALLNEFVNDADYNSKATLMLEESLAQELRDSTTEVGIDDTHRYAIVAILSALAYTKECDALENATKSVDKLTRHVKSNADVEGAAEVYGIYVRKLLGRAARVCESVKDFRAVRRPLRDTLLEFPELGGMKGKITGAMANKRIAEILRDRCLEEMDSTAVTGCRSVWRGYERLCTAAQTQNIETKELDEDTEACAVMKASMPPPRKDEHRIETSTAATKLEEN